MPKHTKDLFSLIKPLLNKIENPYLNKAKTKIKFLLEQIDIHLKLIFNLNKKIILLPLHTLIPSPSAM